METKIQREMEACRGELSLLERTSKGINVKTREGGKKGEKKKQITKWKLYTNKKESIKQKIQEKPPQTRRFEKKTKFFRQNTVFETDTKKFYREILKQSSDIKKTPTMKEVEDFWKKISSNEKKHNEKAEWITRKEERTKRHCTTRMDIYQTETVPICNEEIPLLEIGRNWETAKFWLNVLTTAHLKLTKIISEIMKNPQLIPQ